VNLGSFEEVLAKNYRCQDCSLLFRGFDYRLQCPHCKSINTKIAK
jgi:Zn finger protein HypA/HybF involved in hydrogenase expression